MTNSTISRTSQRTTVPAAPIDDENWRLRAQCRTDPDAMFVKGAEQKMAVRKCEGCPVKQRCLAEALEDQIEWGVWGGLTERQRRALLRRFPHVRSWTSVLAGREHPIPAQPTARPKTQTVVQPDARPDAA